MSGSDIALEARDVSAGYGSAPVLHGLDLRVHSGEVVALLGANGAGKTTTLMVLAGLLPIEGGDVRLGGETTTAPLFKRSRAGLAYVSEERGVFRELTTLENLRLGRGDPAEALELMPELRPLLHRPVGLLSGGEQQMLTIARALASHPDVLLCDELSLGLAPLIVERLLERLREAAHAGVAVLLVEQQIRAALTAADRGYVLRRGSIAMAGTSAGLLGQLDEIEAHYLSGMSDSDSAYRRPGAP